MAHVNKAPPMIHRRRVAPGFAVARLGARVAIRQHHRVMRFLKENWLWIVVPLILFAAAVAAIVLSTGGAGEQPYSFG